MNIKQIKENVTCLDYLADRVVRKVANGYLARCPWREDNHPSLTVTKDGKGWKDLATGEHGNLIDMVQRCLGTNDLSSVCAAFGTITPFSFQQSKILVEGKEKGNGFAFFEVIPLQSRGLYAYLGDRHINTAIARQFLQEAHYSFQERQDGRYLYALAYPNDKGGYELRSSRYKGCFSPKAISTHFHKEGAPLIIFEGFIDMLSFATLCEEVRHNYIVLNSIVNVPVAIEAIRNSRNLYGSILLALDNDDGGNDATVKLLEAFPNAKDIRSKFSPYKDINEYLVGKK